MMSLWDALRMNMMISYQELVRTFPNSQASNYTDYITCRFIRARKNTQLNYQTCTYQSIQSQQ